MKENLKLSEAMLANRIVVETMDGSTFGADSWIGIVSQMRRSSWGGDASDGVRGYMRQVSKRVWDWSQKRVRTSICQVFIEDLAAAGILKLIVRPL